MSFLARHVPEPAVPPAVGWAMPSRCLRKYLLRKEAVRWYVEKLTVDAVIVIMEAHLLDTATIALPPHIQVVVVDSDAGDRYTAVDTDQTGGSRVAVRHLLDLGHDTVWHLGGPDGSFATQRRADAWRTALIEAGRTPPPLVRGDWSARSG